MALNHNAQKSLLDDHSLYCQEEKWEEEHGEESEITLNTTSNVLLYEQDLLWDDEELQSLFFKEKETCIQTSDIGYFPFSLERKEAVEWILKIHAHYGFSALTVILAVNYLDKFLLSCSSTFQKERKPWMMQLAAVTCLSLAAKVEETYVPLLLDLQVEDAKYFFEAKTIQRMELLVLSGLKWRMNPVTPLSFLDHIVRRLGLKRYIHWEFLRRCENLLLSVISDSRILRYMPSVLATATMLHVIHQVEHCNNAIDYENQLLSVLKISKDEVDDCYQLILDILSKSGEQCHKISNSSKRKSCQFPSSASGGMSLIPSDTSNDSWGSSSSCISSSSSTHQPIFKKRRVREQQMKLPSLSRVFVDAIKSPQ
ncbi:G1/S-specific cyclin D [Handroanthus impetiginosus]|uniref:G1/S-specific cyclin D n=1 Tax=Handroanthus impetiginosus TaxID=429701 RepID=A0A2G9HJA3_9LAMI|nr:G1/S-specific cyclin D [Handroanthus impetiginosus]